MYSLRNYTFQTYPLIIPVGKLIESLRLIFLIMISLIAAASGKAQSDTVRVAQELKEGANHFINHALSSSRSIASAKWTNASLQWKGNYYMEANNRSF